MKLQNLTVIFAVIIIPITLILSAYIGSQIDTASLQQSYDTTLMDATHDAVVAFELNTENNDYSTNADSIRRDIQAAINTFSSSLASGLGSPGANSEYIMPYVPAILITLYDGYYIYSPSEYTYKTKEYENGEWVDKTKTGYTHILKPYIYYSKKYESVDGYVIVNYSLDNYITVYGKIGNDIISKSGYLETEDVLDQIDTQESLSEYIIYKDPNTGNIVVPDKNKRYQFVYKDGKKVYKIGRNWYTLNGLELTIYNVNNVIDTDTSAGQYVDQAKTFMKYLQESGVVDIVIDEENNRILDINSTNDPEDPASLFNQHKREVIKNSIQNNLNNAMAIYNANSGAMGTNASFQMPKISETDWEKILTNVNIVTFMQGLPVGNKTYNNYSIVTSTNNKQYIDPTTIYFVDNNKYHTIYDNWLSNIAGSITGYKAQDFRKVKYEVTYNGTTTTKYYYRRPEYACYDCKVSLSFTETTIKDILNTNAVLKQKYYTALARERYNLDKVTKVFMD